MFFLLLFSKRNRTAGPLVIARATKLYFSVFGVSLICLCVKSFCLPSTSQDSETLWSRGGEQGERRDKQRQDDGFEDGVHLPGHHVHKLYSSNNSSNSTKVLILT